MEIDEISNSIKSQAPISTSNSSKLKANINYDNIKKLNLKNKLKDRYRKLLEEIYGIIKFKNKQIKK